MENGQNVKKLPPYRALLVVDVKDFSGRPGRYHDQITEQIPNVLQNALIRCGHSKLRDKVRFHTSTGDGYCLGFNPRYLPFLLNPFLPELQKELEYNNATSRQDQQMRMRVSITVGPMTDTGCNTISDGSGDARVEAHRMIDAEPVRQLLSRSGAATCVAAIVSERVYQDAVLGGFTGEDPSLYVPVDVEVKTYRGKAYVRVPKPSGDLLTSGFHLGEAAERVVEPSPEPERTEPEKSGAPSPRVGINIGSMDNPRGPVVIGEKNKFRTGNKNVTKNKDITNQNTENGINIAGDVSNIRHSVRKGGHDGDKR